MYKDGAAEPFLRDVAGSRLPAMGELPNKLLDEALKLPPGERAALADSLLRSLEGPVDPAVDAAWRAEIRRRVADLDAGAPTVPWAEARAEIMRP